MQVSLSPGDKLLDRDQGIELRALEPGEGERERGRGRDRDSRVDRPGKEREVRCRVVSKRHPWRHPGIIPWQFRRRVGLIKATRPPPPHTHIRPPSAPHPGIFLPVTSSVGGILSVKPRHYLASRNDVLHLSPHLADMTEQQGYVCCLPDGKNHGAKPLNFVIKVGGGLGGGKSRSRSC